MDSPTSAAPDENAREVASATQLSKEKRNPPARWRSAPNGLTLPSLD